MVYASTVVDLRQDGSLKIQAEFQWVNLKLLGFTQNLSIHDFSECPKGRRDVDFPKDDYFMALALLATSRSPFEEKVYIQ